MNDNPFAVTDLTRPPVADEIKGRITDALAAIPEGKSAAVLAIVDAKGGRLHVAAKIGDTWKVGAVVGRPWQGKPFGYVAVEASW